jgi:hypothetical protein
MRHSMIPILVTALFVAVGRKAIGQNAPSDVMNLNGIRFANSSAGKTAADKITASIADCASLTSCIIVGTSSLPEGNPPRIPETALFWDMRGNHSHAGWHLTSGMVPENFGNSILFGIDDSRSNPTSAPAAFFIAQKVTGDFTDAQGGATWAQFNFAQIHDASNVPGFYNIEAGHFESWGYGSLTSSPHVRLLSEGDQSVISGNSSADTGTYQAAYDGFDMGPYMREGCTPRAGRITVTYGNTTVTGSGTNFSSGDVDKELFAGPSPLSLDNAQTFGTVQKVGSSTSLTLSSAWKGATRTGVAWTTQSSPATSACGATANVQITAGRVITQSPWGTASSAALVLQGGLPETPSMIQWLQAGNSRWEMGQMDNPAQLAASTQNDFILRNHIYSGIGFRFQNQTNGNVYIGATGGGSVIINGAPRFAGENNSPQGTGGLKVYAGGISSPMSATPNGLVEAGAIVPRMSEAPSTTAPTFDARQSNSFKVTLVGDVARSTLSNAMGGQPLYFLICQDKVGSHNFAWPSNVQGGMRIGTEASTCSAQSFIFDGRNAYATSPGAVSP